jgi:hypothetical protein
LALLITAGMQEALRDSKWLGVRIDIEETALVASAMLDGKTSGTSGPAAFAMPARPSDGALPNLSVPRRIAAFSLWRDLHAFYSAKDELFPERTSSLIFFENMMGIFFTGRDLTDEVMAELSPQIRIVVAEQAYGPAAGTPTTRVPAFAAVLQLRNPARFGVIAEEAWQKAVGLINFTRGQQALPGLLIDRPSYGGVRYTVASYSSAADYDEVAANSRANFQPSLAMVGDYLILSSAEGLTRDLIAAVKAEAASRPAPLPNVHTLVEVDNAQLASALSANREHFIRQNMVEKGNAREQAEAQTDILIAVLRHLGQADLRIGFQKGQARAHLRLRPSIPDAGNAQAARRARWTQTQATIATKIW